MIENSLIYEVKSNLSCPISERGCAILIHGWCYHQNHKIKRLYLLLDGDLYKVSNYSNIRFDVFQEKRHPNSINSGFWTIFHPYPKMLEASKDVYIHVILDNGKYCDFKVGTIKAKPLFEENVSYKTSFNIEKSNTPLVTICMATYNPPIDLFIKQINSIIQQSHENWICIINDDCSKPEIFMKIKEVISRDTRFYIYRNSLNLGFYYNFEQSLLRVPKESAYIAFSDQDDFWHKDKLEACLSQFDEDTTLVYSDMNIVDSVGKLIYNTYWTTRRNNYKELDHLLLANTITGAASVFRSDLLDTILPFPERIGDSYHDWWVACVALAKGKIKYIDRPLYDYTQHSNNVLGHFANQKKQFNISSVKLRRFLNIKQLFQNIEQYVWGGLNIYNYDFMRIVYVANTLKVRCYGTSPEKLSIIKQFSGFENSINGLLFQFFKGFMTQRCRLGTLGAENRLLGSVLTNKLIKLYITSKMFIRSIK